MRDMVQNHMMQLLCLIAMEPPSHFNPDAVRDEKLKVIRALDAPEHHQIVRGQYDAGEDGPSYRTDAGQPRSRTESFIAMRLHLSNWRWAGTPFYLRTGKRLRARTSEIAIVFKDAPHSIFGAAAGRHRNILTIRLQPNEGMELGVTIKEPGPGGMRLVDVPLDMSFSDALGPDAEHIPMPTNASSWTSSAAPDPVHARRRGRGGLGLDRSGDRRVGIPRRRAQDL
jgi:glucose-6-phosphate 1-dehydrogenase